MTISQVTEWRNTIHEFFTSTQNDKTESHHATVSAIRYPLSRLEQAFDQLLTPAEALIWIGRIIGITDSMMRLNDTGMDVCDSDLFEDINDTMKQLEALVRAEIRLAEN